MSTRIQVRIEQPLDGDSIDHGAFVEVRSLHDTGASRLISKLSVPVGDDASRASDLQLEPGRYDFSAVLPSGSVLSQTVEVTESSEPVQVTLHAGPSPHEWLAWQQWSGNVSDVASVGALQKSMARSPNRVKTPLDTAEVSLWRPDEARSKPSRDYLSPERDGVWSTLEKRLSELEEGEEIEPSALLPDEYLAEPMQLLRDPPYAAVKLPLGRKGGPQRAYLHARVGAQSMLCAVPWPWLQVDGAGEALVEAVIAIDEESIERDDADPDDEKTWSVRPTVRDRTLSGVLAYFASGEQGSARELCRTAQRMLFEKQVNPFGAAGGAYILVSDWIIESAKEGRANRSTEWMHWIENLSRWFPWLPDGAILEGWLALRMRGKEPRLGDARVALLEAERRGIPVYAAGVRRLLDGLLLLSGEMRRQGTPDEEVDSALARVRRLAWQIDPRQPFTCVRLWSS